MIRYDRRTFIKHSAMLAATATAVQILPPFASGSPPASAVDWQDTPHPFFANATNTPEVIAHRGGNGQWPGGTLRAFRAAAKLKADILELDVFISLDGELMVMHDHEVNKTTEGTGEINKLHSNYVQSLNAGHKWSPDGKNYPFKNKSVSDPVYKDLRVPRLREVFEEFPGARMIIEMKKADRSPAQALSRMISEFEMKNKVLVASFVGKFMEEFRQLNPDVATSFSLSRTDAERLISGKKLSKNDPADPRAIQLPFQLITKEVVRRARERNIKVHAWTVNDPDKMYLMWNLGVDGIITDYPGPLLALLGRFPG
jgi:glycerophosphoryl diester phosphodiesterase